ncbi:MAG: pilus assembly protein TadG-related protein [Limnohabitans sp.]
MHTNSLQLQKGQALIYGLFVLTAGLAGLFFLFNTGQLAYEKSKLVNTADAVAYSGGIMNARALNFQAYTNRAMIANTVAIAQLVSLSSWVTYAQIYGQWGGAVAYNPKYYGALLIPYTTAEKSGA